MLLRLTLRHPRTLLVVVLVLMMVNAIAYGVDLFIGRVDVPAPANPL